MSITNPDYSNVNHEEMAASIGLNVKHMPMLIASFLKESTPILETLNTQLSANDYVGIKASAHSIKGSAANLRFNELAEMAREVEHAAETSNSSFDYASYLEAMKKAVGTIAV